MTDIALPGLEEESAPEEPELDYPLPVSSFLAKITGDGPIWLLGPGDGSILADYKVGTRWTYSPTRRKQRHKDVFTQLNGTFAKLKPFLDKLNFDVTGPTIVDRTDADNDHKQSDEFLKEYFHTTQEYPLVIIDTKVTEFVELRDERYVPFCAVEIPEIEKTITFFGERRALRDDDYKIPVRKSTLDTLELFPAWVHGNLAEAQVYALRGNQHSHIDRDLLRAVNAEYVRRVLGRTEKPYDVYLVGNTLRALPSPWVTQRLQRIRRYDIVNLLHNAPSNLFASNPGAWEALKGLATAGDLLLDPQLYPIAEEMVKKAYFTTTPLFRLPNAMRIGYLTDVDNTLVCIKSDEEKGFREGEAYPFRMAGREIETEFPRTEEDKNTGIIHTVTVQRPVRFLDFYINNDRGERKPFTDRNAQDINYILEHFDVKDPGDIATRYPEVVEAEVKALDRIEEKYLKPRGLSLRKFQKGDLARVCARGRVILAHEQGMGKTPEGLTFIHRMWEKPQTRRAALVVAPDDLIPQWQREGKKFYGVEINRLVNKPPAGLSKEKRAEWYRNEIIRVRDLAKRIQRGEENGIWIVSFHQLAQFTKRLNDVEEPHIAFRKKVKRRRWDPEVSAYVEYEEWEEYWSSSYCPKCHKPWNGDFHGKPRNAVRNGRVDPKMGRSGCNYSAHNVKLPRLSNLIANAFRRGVVVVDEGTMIANSTSQRTESVRGLRGKWRLTMTGTPIKNFVGQSFPLMSFTIGINSDRFPYGYDEEKRFLDRYGVWERKMKPNSYKWTPKKQVGATTNHSLLWKQFASCLMVNRKDLTGEYIPPKKVHIRETGLGIYQREQMESWRLNFGDWYGETYPERDTVKRGMHLQPHNFPRLGIEMKWDWACVLPKGDDDHEWTQVPVSNFTPMMFETLRTALYLIASGRRPIISSNFKQAALFIAKRLEEKGVAVSCLVDDAGNTVGAEDRSDAVLHFQDGISDSLVSTIGAIKLGHNLDKGNAVIFHGLPWDWESFSQYQDRVHRLTSENPVDVFIHVPHFNATVVGRKWMSLQDKMQGIQQAINGELIEQDTETPDRNAVMAELLSLGIPATGNEVDEASLEEAWRNFPHVEALEVPDSFKETLAVEPDEKVGTITARGYINPMLTHGDVAESLDRFFTGFTTAPDWRLKRREEALLRATDLASYTAALAAANQIINPQPEVDLNPDGQQQPQPQEQPQMQPPPQMPQFTPPVQFPQPQQQPPQYAPPVQYAPPAQDPMVAFLQQQNSMLMQQLQFLQQQLANLTAAIAGQQHVNTQHEVVTAS